MDPRSPRESAALPDDDSDDSYAPSDPEAASDHDDPDGAAAPIGNARGDTPSARTASPCRRRSRDYQMRPRPQPPPNGGAGASNGGESW